MLERLKYKNHINEIIDFGADGIYVDTNELHDYEWAVTSKNNKIASFGYGVVKRKLPVIILCDTDANGIAARNRLHEVTEKDVLSMHPGRVIIGDYYYRCYVTKSQKKSYQTNKRYINADLTLTSDSPYWVKETKYTFSEQDTSAASAFLDFPIAFPYDYTNSTEAQEFNNTGFVDTNFRLVIYGACTNPSITINGHVYQVNVTVEAGQYLTIDSSSKQIYLTDANGVQTNKFNSRNKQSYIFQKLKPGLNSVTWDGSFAFDVTTLEERSEPKWI